MNPYKYSILLVASLLGLSQNSNGQEDLLTIYQRALQNDPIIREAEAIYLATIETKPQARSRILPQLSLNAGASTSNSEDPYPATNFQTGEPSTIVVSTESAR